MLRSSLLSVAALTLAGSAFAGTAFTAELLAPVAGKEKVVANKAVWSCEDASCSAELARKNATVRECKKFVKEVGAVASFGSVNGALDEADLATCNAAAKR